METQYTYEFSQSSFLLKFDNSLNINNIYELGHDSDCKSMLYNDNKLIILEEGFKNKRIHFIINDNDDIQDIDYDSKCFCNKEYFVIKDKFNQYTIYNSDLKINKGIIDVNKIFKEYYCQLAQDFINDNYPDCYGFFLRTINNNKCYCVMNRSGVNNIAIYDSQNNSQIYSINKIENYRIHDFYVLDNEIYLLYVGHKNYYYYLIKYDFKGNILEKEEYRAYSSKFVMLSGRLCIVCDLPKNYSSEQKKLKNQELMGNSSIIILK